MTPQEELYEMSALSDGSAKEMTVAYNSFEKRVDYKI
jgi:hypothetical protein